MDVLLINPRTDTRQRPPLGLSYIAAVIRQKGLTVAIFDPLPSNDVQEKLSKLLKEHHPKIVGITATTTQILSAYELSKIIKETDPKIITVAGGPHVTASPIEVINNKYIDIAVVGEGEQTAPELFKTILKGEDVKDLKGICYKKNGKAIQNEPAPLIQNLDEIPFPARDLLDEGWYSKRGSLIRGLWLKTATIITSRGCPGMCVYCSSHITFGRKIRRRSVKNVIEEIKQLVKKYNIQGVFFCDDTMTMDHTWMTEFCNELKKLDKKLVWACQSRVNTVTEELLLKMKEAGCIQIEYGCESGSQKILDVLKKNITIEQIIEAFKVTKKAGIRTMANFMIGNPEETQEDVKLTAEFAKKLDADWNEFWITTPYPGSELFQTAKKNGWIKLDLNKGIWMHGYDTACPVMEINFNGDELLKMRDKLYVKKLSSILKGLAFTPSFIYDLTKHIVTNPKQVLNSARMINGKEGFVNFGFSMEKQLRGAKKDIII